MESTSAQDFLSALKSIAIKQVKLGPLQQACYSITGEEVKRPVVFAGMWAIPAVWFFLNSAGLPAIGMLLCALCEMTTKNDYDNLDDLRLAYDPDYSLPYSEDESLPYSEEEEESLPYSEEESIAALEPSSTESSTDRSLSSQRKALQRSFDVEYVNPSASASTALEKLPRVSREANKTPVTALSELLAAPMENRAFIGAQRTGKSGLANIAGKRLADTGVTFFQINLASYSDGGSEDDAYCSYIHPENTVRGDLAVADKREAKRLVEDSTSLVHTWFRTPNSILIVDEWFSLASKSIDFSELTYPLAQLIAGKLAHLTSAGTKRRLALWLITPQCKAGSMTDAGKEIKSCKLCFVGINPSKTVQWGGNRIHWNAELFDYVKANFSITQPSGGYIRSADRIAYINGQWLPLGTTAADFEAMQNTKSASPVTSDEGVSNLYDSTTASVELPAAIPGNIANQIADYLVAVLNQNKDKLPMSQAALASSDTKLKKVKSKLGSDGWSQFLRYCDFEGRLILEETSKGVKLNLPNTDCEESWDDIISC